MYRDEREALLHRIASLESQLVDLESMRQRLAWLEQENRRLAAELASFHPPSNAAPVVPGVTLRVRGPGIDRVQSFDKDIVKSGRQQSADLCIEHPSLGRFHAVLKRSPEGYTVLDLGTSSGTIVNGQRTDKSKVGRGDAITLGPFTLTIE